MNRYIEFSLEDIDFQTENELITIIPKFHHPTLHLIQGDFGDFVPGREIRVPLWLAVSFKKRGKCTIRPYEWLNEEWLTKMLEDEIEHTEEFLPMHRHFFGIASLLLSCAPEDIKDADKVRMLIADIENIRASKIRKGMTEIAKQAREDRIPQNVKLTNISSMEIYQLRAFLKTMLENFYSVSGVKTKNDMARQREQIGHAQGGDMYRDETVAAYPGPFDEDSENVDPFSLPSGDDTLDIRPARGRFG